MPQHYIVQKPASCVYSHQPGPQNTLKQVASPSRLRTAVAPLMQLASYPQVSIQTTSALPAAIKERATSPTPSLGNTMHRLPQQQAQSPPAVQGAHPAGAAAAEQQQQQQQFEQAVTAKLQAHQLAQGQASASVPAASQVEQPSSCPTIQTHPQDLVRTIQVSSENMQARRPSAEDHEAERRMIEQSLKEAVEEIELNKKENNELQGQLLTKQAEVESLRHDRLRAEQELAAKVGECDKDVMANRKLEGEKRLLESGNATLKIQNSEKSEELQKELAELQLSHQKSQSAREEAQRLQAQSGELTAELADAEEHARCQQQLQKEQKARQNSEVDKEAQRRQIEELHNRVIELRRAEELLEREMQPRAVMTPAALQQQNMELQLKLADAQGDLYNVLGQLQKKRHEQQQKQQQLQQLQQLEWQQGEARNVRAG